MAGVDLETVQELLGRKVVVITEYAHFAPTRKWQSLVTLVGQGLVSVQGGRNWLPN